MQSSAIVEETLKRIQSHRGVSGVLIINSEGITLKSTLSPDETEQYAALISQVRQDLLPLRNFCRILFLEHLSFHSHFTRMRLLQLSTKARSVIRTLDPQVRNWIPNTFVAHITHVADYLFNLLISWSEFFNVPILRPTHQPTPEWPDILENAVEEAWDYGRTG